MAERTLVEGGAVVELARSIAAGDVLLRVVDVAGARLGADRIPKTDEAVEAS